jgi:hypothetical protein
VGTLVQGKFWRENETCGWGKVLPVPASCIKSASGKKYEETIKNVVLKAHCNENPIYVNPEKKLCGLSPNFHTHVSVSDLYIPKVSPQNRQRQTDFGNI